MLGIGCLGSVQGYSSHSRPERPRSLWSAPRIETSGRLQHRKSAIHGLIVKCGKFDWLKLQNEHSARALNIGFCQRSRFLMLTERIAASGDENVVERVEHAIAHAQK